jgi:hypothetical protein
MQLDAAEQEALRERYRSIIRQEIDAARLSGFRAMNAALECRAKTTPPE